MKIPPVYSAVYVAWLDMEKCDTWKSLHEVNDSVATIHTVGLLVNENGDILTIARDFDETYQEVRKYIIIPKRCCLFIRRLTDLSQLMDV